MMYNFDFEIAALLLEILLLVFVSAKYDRNDLSVRRYKILLYVTTAATVLDTISGITISYSGVVSVPVNLFIATVYFALSVQVAYAFERYANSVNEESKQMIINARINFGIIIAYYVMLGINLFKPILFGFDENGQYYHCGLFFITFVILAYFILNALVFSVYNSKRYSQKQRLAIYLSAAFSFSGVFIQLFFTPTILLTYFFTSFGQLCMLFSQETPDYNKLKVVMEELREAKEDAEAATRTKTNFLASMSNEIRTPINSIIGLNEMILRESAEAQTRQYAKDIQNTSKTLLGIINDILDLSKVESGRMEIVPTEYKLGSLIHDLENMVSYKAREKGLYFVVKANPKMPHFLYGDEIRIKQVIFNILTNAVKYTDRGGAVLTIDYEKISADTVDITFQVKDTGKGIKKDDIAHLFNAFETRDAGKTHKADGTGLGLSISQQFLQMMGTELKVQSIYEVGSIFSFTLRQKVISWEPIGDIKRFDIMEEKPVYQERFTAPNARILVVDDAEVNLTVFRGLLKKTNVTVDTAICGADAIKMSTENIYDMIFIDHMMPNMDGIETLKHIRNDISSRNAATPSVALTANAVAGAREKYVSAGFTDYLSKPINPISLEEMIMYHLPKELITKAV